MDLGEKKRGTLALKFLLEIKMYGIETMLLYLRPNLAVPGKSPAYNYVPKTRWDRILGGGLPKQVRCKLKYKTLTSSTSRHNPDT